MKKAGKNKRSKDIRKVRNYDFLLAFFFLFIVACVGFSGYNNFGMTGNVIYNSSNTQITACGDINEPGVYTLMNNITASGTCIILNSDNITLDGQGYTLNGPDSNIGVSIIGRTNITIQNLSTIGFMHGLSLNSSNNSMLTDINTLDHECTLTGASYSWGVIISNSNNNTLRDINSSSNPRSGHTCYHGGISLFSSNYTLISTVSILGSTTAISLSSSSYNNFSSITLASNTYSWVYDSDSLNDYLDGVLFTREAIVNPNITFCGDITAPGVYTLINNITASGDCLRVNSDNVTLDGHGYIVLGSGSGRGIFILNRTNITIQNLSTIGFMHGLSLNSSNNSMLTDINSSNNDCADVYCSSSGMLLSNSNNNTLVNLNIFNSNCSGNYCSSSGILFNNSNFNIVSNSTIGSILSDSVLPRLIVAIPLYSSSYNNFSLINFFLNNQNLTVDVYSSNDYLDGALLFACGDGIVNGAEQCDGTNFSGSTCSTYNFNNGSLSCSVDCLTISTSGCSNSTTTTRSSGGGGGGGSSLPKETIVINNSGTGVGNGLINETPEEHAQRIEKVKTTVSASVITLLVASIVLVLAIIILIILRLRKSNNN